MRDNGAKGCFKYGCFGCLALFALCVGLLLLAGAINVTVDREPRPEERELVRELPSGPFYPSPDREELPSHLELPDGFEPRGAGRIFLDLAYGEFRITTGPEEEPIRVEADYDAAAFELEEDFTPDEGAGWSYELTFGSRGGFLGLLFGGGGNFHNRVELVIPRGHRIDLIGEISMGESKTDLTGLWLRSLDLELGMGEHFLEIREPAPVPMESMRLSGSMGSLEVRGVGNASPRDLQVSHSMGEMLLDLGGLWRRDAEIDGHFGMGEMRVWLPRDARIDLERSSVSLGEARTDELRNEDVPPGAPTLVLRLHGSMGQLRVER